MAIGGVILALGCLVALARSGAREEVLRQMAEKEVEDARKKAEVMVQHRTVGDTVGRLRQHSF